MNRPDLRKGETAGQRVAQALLCKEQLFAN